MYSKFRLCIYWILIVLFSSVHQANAQVNSQDFAMLKQEIIKQKNEIESLRTQINQETYNLKQEIDSYAPMFLVLFLFGGFCALWAQNTGRSAWGWFFLGMIFSVLTVITVLVKNYYDDRV